MEWELDDMQFECKNDFGTSCLFSKPVTYEENYIKKSLEHLTPIFKMPKLQVNFLTLTNMEERDAFFTESRIKRDLDGLLPDVPLHVKQVHFFGYDMDNVIRFLSAMKPGYLETISLEGNQPLKFTRENFEAIFKTDQFKQAKEVSIHRNVIFSVEDLVNFSHLKRFSCALETIMEPKKILRILDIVSTFEEFKSCDMSFSTQMYRFPYIEKFAEAVGVEIPDGPQETLTFCYQRPESNEDLEFEIRNAGFRCYIEIYVYSNESHESLIL
ncbi:hypothetical protein B9Z55_026959 [Caenorhabditis nigoni]|uniref:DUF38 domain-containing protein n=2 Tax=Caenorhabditis nigoni TaxID=1611254 RepID=A0A2G5SIM2_9PELO|nr:hypothetical protein B9Z55_026959 [Caenorhabditis nigoni]